MIQTREDTEVQLDALCAELGDEELRVVAFLATRLLEGQRVYGRLRLATDARDWGRQRAEEFADAAIYTAFEAVREQVRS